MVSVAVASDEGVTASMWWWQKRGRGGGRGVARKHIDKRKWMLRKEVGGRWTGLKWDRSALFVRIGFGFWILLLGLCKL